MRTSLAKSWHVSHASDLCLLLSWLITLSYVILKDTTQENARCLLFFCLRLNDRHLRFRQDISVETCSSTGLCVWPLAWKHLRIRGSQRAQEKGFFFFSAYWSLPFIFHRYWFLLVELFLIFILLCNLFLWFLEKMRSNNNYYGKENVNIKSKSLFLNFHRRWENTRNHNMFFTIVRLQLFFSFLKMLQYIILSNNIQQKCRWLLGVLMIRKITHILNLHQ